MNRQRLIVFAVLTLVFVGVSLLYFTRAWTDAHTRFRTGLPVPQDILPDILRNPDDIIPDGPPRLPDLRPSDPLLAGNASSVVTIVTFGDYQCEFCRDQAASLREALKTVDAAPNAIRVVWRDLPLVNQHPRAMAAAVAGQCAARQGKFRQMHDALFFQAKDLSDAEVLSFASDLKLNSDAFLTCMRDPAITFGLQQDLEDARSHAITSVPMTFVNGQVLQGYVDVNTLAAVIRRQLDLVSF